jgi:hypothetical protein
MTDAELNKLLHEKVMGKKWKDIPNWQMAISQNPSYTTNPAEYWELLQEVSKKPYWKVGYYWSNFIQRLLNPGNTYDDWIKPEKMIRTILLDMPKGCSAILEFFGKEEG